MFSGETWRKDDNLFDSDSFPYLEISAVGLGTNEYQLEDVKIENAPSRARMVLRENDIVISTTRPHRGAIAKIKAEQTPFIGSTGFAVIRNLIDESFNPTYLLNTLFSNLILKQFFRRSSGGSYPAITLDELSLVKIPKPPLPIQEKLVEEMERARESRRRKLLEANQLLSTLDGWLLETLGITPPPEDNRKVFAVRLSNVIKTSRLNSDYFHPERLLAVRNIEQQRGTINVAPLHSIADFIRSSRKSPTGRYLGLANVQSHTGEFVNVDEKVEGNVLAFAENDVLFGRLRPYLNKVYRAEFDGECSPEFHVMRTRNDKELNADYLAVILRSSIILAQTKHMMTGNTHPRLTNEDVVNLVIPIPSIAIQEMIADEIKKRKSESRRLKSEAESEWQAAKDWFETRLLGEN